MNARRTFSVKPQLETLEDRNMPTTMSLSNGILSIVGTDRAETIKVTLSGSKMVVAGVGSVNASSVRSVSVDARGGNDTIDLRALRIGATIYAGAGNDFVVGTAGDDIIFGGDGDDRIFGMGGNDWLYGNNGNDRLFGMTGNDYLFGEDGNDFLDDGNRTGQEYADGGTGTNFNADIVAVNGTTYDDIHQQGAPTCGFLSTLSGLAMDGYDFTQWIRYASFTADGTPQYDVAFWRGSGWTWTRVNFDGTLTWNDTAPVANGESWVVLMQRGWIKFHGNGGQTWPHEAIFALTGQQPSVAYAVADDDYDRIANALQNNRVVIAATVSDPSSLLVGNHAYTVTAVWGSGDNLWVQVRNPWGYDGGTDTYDDPNDALVWLTWQDFQSNMRYLAIA